MLGLVINLKYLLFKTSGSYDNNIGIPYILMSKASGRLLSEYDWIEFSLRVPGYPTRFPLLPLADQNREKIMSQLGIIMSSLSQIRFNKIGPVFEDSDSNYFIGECLSPPLLWQWRDTLEGIDRGAFNTESQYFSSLISAFISHAKELPLAPHSFFAPIPDPFEYPHWTSYRAAMERWRTFCSVDDKIEGSKNRLSYCIAGQFLHKMVPYLASPSEDFVLSHPDLHSGNIFVDENFNITCIIDWGSTTSCPMTELLVTPGFSSSVSPPTESLVAAFRTGFSQGGQKFESEQWEKAERMLRFSRLVRLISAQDYTLFKVLYELVYDKGLENENIPRLFHEQSMQEYGKELLAELREDELAEEEEVKGREDDKAVHTKESEGLAVARKLTLVSEMNPNFVADKTLWQWIENAL